MGYRGDRRPIPDSNGRSLDDVRSRLSGLHFAKEQLSIGETEILLLAECLLRYIDADERTAAEAVKVVLVGPMFTERVGENGYVKVQFPHVVGRQPVWGVRREVAEAAYAEYARQYGTSQSFDRLHERGGFSVDELVSLLTEALSRYAATGIGGS